jgi:hypothetical protein
MEIGRNNPRIEGTSHAHGAQPTAGKEMSPELKTNRDKVKKLAEDLPFGKGKPPMITQGRDPRVADFVKNRL